MMFRKPDGAGKGDMPRPIADRNSFENNWDSIFGNKKEKTDEQKNSNTALHSTEPGQDNKGDSE
jgi:hypothetical protein